MSIELRQTEGGVILPVKVHAGARKTEVRGVQNGALKVSVTAVAEKGKANQAVIRLLADRLEIPKSAFEIISGTSASQKQLSIAGTTASELEKRLKKFLPFSNDA